MTYSQKILEISSLAYQDEKNYIEEILPRADFFRRQKDNIYNRAKDIVESVREQKDSFAIENFLKEYSLSSYEGIAVMCLAEALLRIPDSNTADELIEDKLVKGNWKKHINTESGFLINSSSWGLLIGSRFINKQGKNSLEKALKKVISEASEPIIRNAIKAGMEILGQGFVIGETIKSAVKKAKKLKDKYGYYFSFDMLGEGARTREQAKRYYETYKNCIEFVSEHITQQTDYPDSSIYKKPNVSIKLSALHPRYELNKAEVIKKELLPDIKALCKLAKEKGVWISIDAEESYRLDLSLMLFEELYKDKELNDWGGLGVVVQAYGKRALKILEYLKDLSKDHDVKIPVRLVKGAYWDSEIKYAQELGLKSYSVFTKKSHTDLNYLVCSDYMMDNLDNFYPQFASHSALTISSIFERLEDKNIDPKKYEMQKLFGMGDSIYRNIVNDGKHPVRIYAPVGSYEDLLPYLIRRILENGANNSFISKVADVNEPIEEILSDPIEKIISSSYTSKNIPLPEEIYSPDRINSKGYDIGNLEHLEKLKDMITEDKTSSIKEKSIINGEEVDLTDYEDHELDSAINKSIKACLDYKKNFKVTHIQDIEEKLEKLSYLIEDHEEEFFNLLTHEAKKTITDADAEIREAIDFLRYYSSQAVQLYSERDKQKGYTGEVSKLYYRPKGIFLCISPWNFPLAIFTGQVAAALATGNSVIAKPAEQTPKLAYLLCKLAYKAGIDKRQLHLIMGDGAKVGKKLTEIQEISGFAFTGSTGTAKLINKTIAEKHDALKTLIAETGGQNCFMVDSSALLERACDDVIYSAFGSAGQRCSAARVLYVQEDVADKFIEMLKGAVRELKVSKACEIDTDLSAVIDSKAEKALKDHIKDLESRDDIEKLSVADLADEDDNYVRPHIFKINEISDLKQENFGPILHVRVFKRKFIDKIIDEINSTSYGLTFGIHSRIVDFTDYVCSRINAGNIYINRTITGAIVETHPFGGMNLSGTGFKAGGPNYIKKFVNEVTITDNVTAIGGNVELLVE